LNDVFDLQDQVTARVVAAIEPNLVLAEIQRALRKSTQNLQAYELMLRALPHFHTVTSGGLE
jgi:adenylate cyclase